MNQDFAADRLPRQGRPAAHREATATYNFVPLPDVVVRAVESADQLPSHATYADPDYPYTGYFDVTLTTMSPVYVRGGLSTTPGDDGKSEFDKSEAEKLGQVPADYARAVKNKPEFFYTRDRNEPVIPGSTLRGLLRNLLEIVAYGKVQWVSDKRLFYRTVDDSYLGRHYTEQMVEPLGRVGAPPHPGYRPRVRGGFFRKRSNGTFFIEECVVARLEMHAAARAFGLQQPHQLYELNGQPLMQPAGNPNQTPRWAFQHRDIWVDVGPEQDNFFPAQFRPNGQLRHPALYLRFREATDPVGTAQVGKKEGKLVLTGAMQHKHLAFVFLDPRQLDPAATPAHFEVPNDPREEDGNKRLVDRFHDDDQMTRWQRLAFPNGKPGGAQRGADGHLRDGEPVFFLTDPGGRGTNVVFFGRPQMFRLPYDNRPIDLVPEWLRSPEAIDYAEALFGFVRTRAELEELESRGVPVPKPGSPGRSYAGRVSVTDATLAPGQTDYWLTAAPFPPKILASPKPTAVPLYLLQTSDHRLRLKHYDSPGDDGSGRWLIRGHKLYWHRGQVTADQLRAPGQVLATSTQHTRLRPVRPGLRFTFRVYLDNLSRWDLGALAWILHPAGAENRTYCHSLGMGKALGMGAVKLDATLHLTDRLTRYGSLFLDDTWQTGMSGPGEPLSDRQTLGDLTRAFEEHVLDSLGLLGTATTLADVKRTGTLLKLLEWDDNPTPEWLQRTQSMTLDPQDRGFRERKVLPDPSHLWPDELSPLLEPILSGPGILGPTDPEPPPAKTSTTEEVVTLAVAPKSDGKATVRTERGESIPCSGTNRYPPLSKDAKFVAKVTREDGTAVAAEFSRYL